jgi:hypothetical protein
MYTILDSIGAYLYVIFFVVTFPAYLVLQCFIGLLIAFKFLRMYGKQLFKAFGVKKRSYHIPKIARLAVVRKAA